MTREQKGKIVYDTLCGIYTTDAVNFFTNVFGMQICEDERIWNELADMGAVGDEDEDTDDDAQWDEDEGDDY